MMRNCKKRFDDTYAVGRIYSETGVDIYSWRSRQNILNHTKQIVKNITKRQ